MGATYGQFCPVAKAMELLDERWTLLVVRELLAGGERFNDLRRGLPRMSPSLLSKRLRELERAGVVRRRAADGSPRYELTEAGSELRPVVEALGRWGVRWVPELGDPDLDPHLLLWDMHRSLALEELPEPRTVLSVRLEDVAGRGGNWWIVATYQHVDLCESDPGYDVTVELVSTLRALTQLWLGDLSWPESVRSGAVRLGGSRPACAAVPRLLGQSSFAEAPRPLRPAAR